jgi:hypothetical protein
MAMAAQAELAQRRVFVNVPYDAAYEEKFLALIAALISIGRIPRCAVEEPVLGRNRMVRIFKLIKSCRVSIHDLSRVTVPPRFNIPFELGITFALARVQGHKFIILESKRYRMHHPERFEGCGPADTRQQPQESGVVCFVGVGFDGRCTGYRECDGGF